MVTTPRFRIHEEERGDDRQRDDQFAARVGRTLEGWKTAASESMGRNPLVTVAAGIALGVALGWLIKRR
jgi:hypothetical protein